MWLSRWQRLCLARCLCVLEGAGQFWAPRALITGSLFCSSLCVLHLRSANKMPEYKACRAWKLYFRVHMWFRCSLPEDHLFWDDSRSVYFYREPCIAFEKNLDKSCCMILWEQITSLFRLSTSAKLLLKFGDELIILFCLVYVWKSA